MSDGPPSQIVADEVALVRRAFTAFQQDDVATMLELLDPEIEVRGLGDVLSDDVYRRPAGVLELVDEPASQGGSITIEGLEYTAVGRGRVLVTGRVTIEHRPGEQFEALGYWVVHVKDGRITECDVFFDEEPALEAVGISRSPADADGRWARLEGADHVEGVVIGRYTSDQRAVARLDDGRTVDLPAAGRLASGAEPGAPVLVYFDEGGRLVGWYLPEQQLGLDLRDAG